MNSKHLLDKSPICFALVESSREIVYANPALCDFLGYSSAEIKSKQFTEITHPDDIEKDVCQFQRLVTGEIGEYRMQKRYLHQSGKVLWGDLFVSLVPDELRSDKYTILASVVDINELKKKELRLGEERSNFKAMFDFNPQAMGIYAIDDMSILEVNQAASNLYGYSREELLKMKGTDLVALERHEQFLEFVSKNESTLSEGKLWEIITKAGERRIIESASHVIDYKGRAARHALLIDVTEKEKTTRALRENEAFISQAEEIANMGSWEWDFVNKRGKWSDNLYRLLHYEPGSVEPLFANFIARVHPDDREGMNRRYVNMLETKRKIEFELRFLFVGKEDRWFQNYIEPETDANGELVKLKGVSIDITRQKKVELTLLENRTFNRLAQRIANMGSWEYDIQRKTTRWSSNFFRILQVNKGEVEPSFEQFRQKVYAEDQTILDQAIETMFREPQVLEFELRLNIGLDIAWVKSTVEPVFDNDRLAKLRGICIDITQRKIQELAIEKSSDSIHQAQVIANMGSWEFDPVSNIGKWSQNLYQLLKVDVTQTDLPFDFYKSLVHPDDLHFFEDNRVGFTESRSPLALEFRMVLPDEQVIWVEEHVEPVFEDGELVLVRGVIIDISERKRTEKIREILVDISNAVLQTDDLETFFNMVFSALAELTTTPNFFVALYDEKRQRATVPFITDEREKELQEFSVDKTLTGLVVRGKKPLFVDVECFDNMVKRGEVERVGPPSLAWIGVPLFADEKVLGVLVLQSYEGEPMLNADDLKLLEYVAPQISLAFERKTHVEELKKALEKSKESDRLKSSFLATMSHELRTPLNPIIGFSSLLLEESEDAMVQEFSQLINHAGKEMLSLVEDLFDLSFHKGQNIKNNPQPVLLVDLYSLARAYLEEALENVGKTDRIEIVFDDLTLNLCYELRLDQGKVLQILAILFNNAVKYTEHGRIEFKIEVLQNPEGVRFAVSDTGIGMKEELIAVIFDEFRQLDDSHTREYGGLGIGLAIAKTLSEIMDGDIAVESQEGVGTTICLELPAAINIREEAGFEHCLCGDEEFSIINGKTILIVDDNHFIYELIRKMLSKFDINLIYGRNGKEAVDLVKERVPDFILMDLVMPVMNGIEATLHIRSICPKVPIAVLTAHSMSKDRQRAFEAGCDTIITNPVHRDILVKILKSQLEKAEVAVIKQL
ncbi:PAS domain-containing protein [Mangrovibacterium sp.]|uniref:PAS domain-containing protein n=1 Tax=Mangrovibacterium sp. TaxID=1961364 RepID=UPI0035662BF6